MRTNPQPGSGPVDGLGLFVLVVLGRRVAGLRGFELPGGGSRVDLRRWGGAVGQNGDDVIPNLNKPAVDEVATRPPARLRAQLTETEPANQRGTAGQDA